MAQETPEQIIARLEAENAKLKQENTEAGEAIGELNEKLANAEAVAPEKVIVTHEKVQYQVLAPKFQHKGQVIEAKDLQGNKEVLAELVKAESGLLAKVEAKK
ncbi:hypothetical protein [Hymenobacter norwichensis]|uniref:hypothetical protein n=1 Tax=Hymenobacter norwichensis TaxID=223903 RepID=UPI0003B7357F|nr:hypothetical protein [Hymenobacter norwichensis]